MKSNLALLIEHFEQEKLRLEKELKESTDLWDFETAESIKRPLLFVYDKLKVLKNLKNPNAEKIERLEDTLERTFMTDYPDDMFSNDEFREAFIKRRVQKEKENKERNKSELKLLKSIKPRNIVDSDKLLGLLSHLKEGQISSIGFEIRDEALYLVLESRDQHLVLSIESTTNREIGHYVHEDNRVKLKTLGFDASSFSKIIPRSDLINEMTLLQDISIIMYDIFSMYGDETIEISVS